MNDRVAMGVYQALGACGVDIPSGVAVVSFDGSELAQWLTPTLTTVGLPFTDLGAAAVRALLDPAARGSGTLRLAMPVVHGESVPSGARLTS